MTFSLRTVTLFVFALFAVSISVSAQAPTPTLSSTASSGTYVRPDAATRRSRYLKSIVGPESLLKITASAGFSTATNSPEEWGPQWKGFGKRVASNFGKELISNSVRYGLDEALTLDSQFYRSENRSTGARLKNALISVVTARNQTGKRVIGVPRLVGTYTANMIAAEAWYPGRYSYKDGLKSGTISLGLNAAFNLVREFILKK